MKKDNIKYAALFGGAGRDRTSPEYLDTLEIGRLLANSGYTVKNGGYGGMMEAVSKGITDHGGKAIGITCEEVGRKEGNSFLTETIVTDRLYERLELLINDTKLFIVQKGGIGTLSEVFLTLDILRKDKSSDRPKMIFIGSIWKKIIDPLRKDLIPEREHQLFQIVENSKELEPFL